MDASEVVGPLEENSGDFAMNVDRAVHKATKKVHDDLHDLKFNTAVAALMELVNYLAGADAKARLSRPENAALARRTIRQLTLLLRAADAASGRRNLARSRRKGSVHVAPGRNMIRS